MRVTIRRPDGSVWTDTFASARAAAVFAARMALIEAGWQIGRGDRSHITVPGFPVYSFAAHREASWISIEAIGDHPVGVVDEGGDTASARALIEHYLGRLPVR